MNVEQRGVEFVPGTGRSPRTAQTQEAKGDTSKSLWPLFGSANQLLSALVLVTLCVFLKVTGRSNKMLFPPLIIMLCVTGTALVERTISLVQAFSAGSATFLVEGLQLIIAILLMILGVIIVVNSLRAYFASKKNSEI